MALELFLCRLKKKNMYFMSLRCLNFNSVFECMYLHPTSQNVAHLLVKFPDLQYFPKSKYLATAFTAKEQTPLDWFHCRLVCSVHLVYTLLIYPHHLITPPTPPLPAPTHTYTPNRWLESDTSTSLCATPRRSSPWPSPTTRGQT